MDNVHPYILTLRKTQALEALVKEGIAPTRDQVMEACRPVVGPCLWYYLTEGNGNGAEVPDSPFDDTFDATM